MKKVIDVNIGGVNFSIEDDAYIKLKTYSASFQNSLPNKEDVQEIMEDIEIRVAELFQKEIKYPNQVIDMKMVNDIITCLGEVEIEDSTNPSNENKMKPEKRLYRNADDKKIAGVCSGLGAYFDVDATLIRVVFLVLLFGFGTGIMLYIVLWIVMPLAKTITQKLEMYGEPITAENIKNYTNGSTRR